MTQFRFATSCVNAVSGEDIQEMCDIEQELDTESFIEFMATEVGISEEILSSLGYKEFGESTGKSPEDLFIKDPTVKCARSYYQGIPCYFVEHSRIEHVFIPSNQFNNLLDEEQSMRRRVEIEQLGNAWDDMTAGKAKTKKHLAAFERTNGEVLSQYRILLASVVGFEDEEIFEYARHLDEKAQNPGQTMSFSGPG